MATSPGWEDFDQKLMTTWPTSSGRIKDRSAQRSHGPSEAQEGGKAKMELSSSLETEVNLPFITADASGPSI